ncbi:MAG TPA: heterodisulfide reductase-related iron-sulfur binding cluster [Burkholderiaceae bacterium]|jgi:Fe-S oxidoreductase|nr:heterodisulfide reductase-related iron-sulfur binding cluster [Burkholderiaceae bacterium]
MAIREGSLQAPQRHPIEWRSAEYNDADRLEQELERVFNICHGCRRCVNLCGAFPTLFDLVDSAASGELDTVSRSDFGKVVDQCYLCDICFMTKCPYVPPHEWNVDFPHLMLRAKAVEFQRSGGRRRDRILSSTDALGHLAGIPVVTAAVNAANRTAPARRTVEAVLGVDRNAWRPEYARRTFRSTARPDASLPVRDGARTPGKLALFSTCYVNYNEPGIGHDLLKILAHNQIPVTLLHQEACCGMPKLELGDLAGVERLKNVNIPVLAPFARDGYAIASAIPSCTLMFKQELPLLFAGDADVRAVAAAFWDPFEYLAARRRDGLLRTDFTRPLGRVSYHIPCHDRVQNIGRKTEEVLKWLPGTEVTTVERCSGHAGSWGVKKEFHATAMKIGRPVFRAMAEPGPDFISSDCQLAGHHIEQGIGQLNPGGGSEAPPRLAHPITLVRMAYGID